MATERPRLPELSKEDAAPSVREVMEAQEAYFGFILNPTKLLGHCPAILEGQAALAKALERSGHLEASLRSLLYTKVASLNGCPF